VAVDIQPGAETPPPPGGTYVSSANDGLVAVLARQPPVSGHAANDLFVEDLSG
jgi:hypothetical protein